MKVTPIIGYSQTVRWHRKDLQELAIGSVHLGGWRKQSGLNSGPAVKYLLETGPIVLIFDGHYSHMNIAISLKKA